MQDVTQSTAAANPGKGRSFLLRLFSTLVLWTCVIGGLFTGIDWLRVLITAVFGILGTWEYVCFQRTDAGARNHGRFIIALSVAYWSVIGRHISVHHLEPSWWLEALALVAVVLGVFIITLFARLEGEITLRRVLNAVFGFIYTTLAFGFIARIMFIQGSPNGPLLFLTVVLVVKFGDMGAYAFGTWLGRHKMIPHISPAKSWEGFGGAIVTSYAGIVIMMILAGDRLAPLTWPHAMIFAPLLCVVGVIGDLAESILKRCHGVKDSGNTLPGIGGILDLTDSLLFAAPVAYFYLKAIA